MQVKNFEDLEIWKDARALTRGIYQLTKRFKIRKRLRSARSNSTGSGLVMSNIAEGFERVAMIMQTLPRDSSGAANQEFIQFLYVAKASCGEVRSQLYVALDQSYVRRKIVTTRANLFDVFDHDQQSDRLPEAQRSERIKIYVDE